MKVSKLDHRFQNLSTTIKYSKKQLAFINSLKPFQGNEWDKSFTGTGRVKGAQSRRDELKESIKTKLNNIQFPHCIYCGFHEKIVGNLQREHIAPKGSHINFVFEAENLILACANCNGFLKKHNKDTISTVNADYKRCTFRIIHPYRDKHQDHFSYTFNNNNLYIKPKKYSRKGKYFEQD